VCCELPPIFLIQRPLPYISPANTFGESSAAFHEVALQPAPLVATTHFFYAFSRLNSPNTLSSSLISCIFPPSSSFNSGSSPSPATTTTRILTAKQTSISNFDFLGSSYFCKYLHLPLSQNRAQSRRVVVVCDRVTSRAKQCCTTAAHSPLTTLILHVPTITVFVCNTKGLAVLAALHLLSLTYAPFATRLVTDNCCNRQLNLTHQPPTSCLRRRPPARPPPRPRLTAVRRRRVSFSRDFYSRASQANSQQTPTRPSVVSLRTCSSPTSSVTRSARTTQASSSVSSIIALSLSSMTDNLQARSARSSVRSGRLSMRSSASPTRPRLPLTRSGTKRRRPPTP
jgi:hypothetical protein